MKIQTQNGLKNPQDITKDDMVQLPYEFNKIWVKCTELYECWNCKLKFWFRKGPTPCYNCQTLYVTHHVS